MTSEGQQALDLLRRIAEALERAHPKDIKKAPKATPGDPLGLRDPSESPPPKGHYRVPVESDL